MQGPLYIFQPLTLGYYSILAIVVFKGSDKGPDMYNWVDAKIKDHLLPDDLPRLCDRDQADGDSEEEQHPGERAVPGAERDPESLLRGRHEGPR